MSKLNYKTSKDYKRLKELLDKGEAVIVKRRGNIWLVQRNRTFIHPTDGAYYSFSSGGFTCSPGLGERYFFEGCKSLDLEFIEPNGEE